MDKLVGLQMAEAKNSYEQAGATNDTINVGARRLYGRELRARRGRLLHRPASGQPTDRGDHRHHGRPCARQLDVAIPYAGQKDEIGQMAAAVEVFKDNALARVQLEAEQKREQADRQRRAETVEGLMGKFNGDHDDRENRGGGFD